MRKLVKMAPETRNLMLTALRHIGLSPVANFPTAIAYRLDYQSGLILQAGLVEFEETLGMFRKRKLKLVISIINEKSEILETVWSEDLDLPKSEHDMTFRLHFTNKFVSITRTCADLEQAGECLSL